jgi:hypothetical protein
MAVERFQNDDGTEYLIITLPTEGAARRDPLPPAVGPLEPPPMLAHEVRVWRRTEELRNKLGGRLKWLLDWLDSGS